jgi:hypothetical protein
MLRLALAHELGQCALVEVHDVEL